MNKKYITKKMKVTPIELTFNLPNLEWKQEKWDFKFIYENKKNAKEVLKIDLSDDE